jgi:DNA-binding NarL/FixJ family response regulator
MKKISVLVIEDNPLIAADIEQCLDNINFTVSGTAYNYADALIQLESNTPDVVLMDINLGEDRDGIDLGKIINDSYQIPFVYLTSNSDRMTIERAKITCPAGYIIKPFDEHDLLAAIEIALYNFSQMVAASQPALSLIKINKQLKIPITKREFEVLKAIYEGKTNQQMSDTLFISVNTIKTHIANVYDKLEVVSRTAAVAKIRSWH